MNLDNGTLTRSKKRDTEATEGAVMMKSRCKGTYKKMEAGEKAQNTKSRRKCVKRCKEIEMERRLGVGRWDDDMSVGE